MNRRQIARQVADECGLLIPHAQSVVDSLTQIMVQEILRVGEFDLPGVGRFEVRWTKARVGRNPMKPQVEIQIPSRPKIHFKAKRDLTDQVIKTLAVVRPKK